MPKKIKKLKKILDQISTPAEKFLDAVENDEPISKEEAIEAYKAISTPEERLNDLLENAERFKGKDGHTPTPEELQEIIKPLIPDVKNGETPTEDRLIELIKTLIPEPIKGDPGINGNEFEAKDIITKMSSIKDGTGFSVFKLKDTEYLRGRGKDQMQWSSAGFKVYTDATLTGDGSFANPLHSISSDTKAIWGQITGTVTSQTDLTSYLSSNYYPLSTNPAGYLTSSTAPGAFYWSRTGTLLTPHTPTDQVMIGAGTYDSVLNPQLQVNGISLFNGNIQTSGEVRIKSTNKLFFGSGDNAYIYYSGSNLIINPGNSTNVLTIGTGAQHSYDLDFRAFSNTGSFTYDGDLDQFIFNNIGGMNFDQGFLTSNGSGNLTATSFITSGGTSSQFVKGDGSLDSSTYLTSLSGALLATGATTGATSQVQTFTNGVKLSNLTNQYIPYAGIGGLLQNSQMFYDGKNLQNDYIYTKNIGASLVQLTGSETLVGGIGSTFQNLWHLTDGSGTTGVDSKGSNNLTLSAATWDNSPRIPGTSKDAGVWGTVTALANFNADAGKAAASPHSWLLMGWVYIPTTTANLTIWNMGDAVSDTASMRLVLVSGVPTLIWGNGSTFTASVCGALSVGWHHFATTYGYEVGNYFGGSILVDGLDQSQYLNNNYNTAFVSPPTGNKNLYLGAGPANTTGTTNMRFQEWAFLYASTGDGYSHFPMTLSQIAYYGGANYIQLDTTRRNFIAGYSGGERLQLGSSTGYDNLLFGSSAGQKLTSGYQNVFMGLFAGQGYATSSVTGGNNIAIGTSALNNITSGGGNVAIGVSAGNGIQSNSLNTYVGNNSGIAHTGDSNTAMGTYALYANSGNENVVMGSYGGFWSKGNLNTIIGAQTGTVSNPSFAGTCTVLGAYAGNSVSNVTGVVMLGYGAGNKSTTDSNVFYLGNVIQSSLANDKAYSLMYGTFSGTAGSLTGQQLTINAITTTLNSDVKLPTAGNGLYIKEGTNATMGLATLVAGVAVVSTTKVTANSRIFLTRQTTAGTIGASVDVTARTAGTSFTITSNGSILDTSTVAWVILEPA